MRQELEQLLVDPANARAAVKVLEDCLRQLQAKVMATSMDDGGQELIRNRIQYDGAKALIAIFAQRLQSK